jgi:hypothetical protein
MHFRDEILRGIRLAAIVFALALLGVVLHRMVAIEASAPAAVAEQPVAAPEAPPKPTPPAITGGLPGSIPPPPPIHGSAMPSVRAGDDEK